MSLKRLGKLKGEPILTDVNREELWTLFTYAREWNTKPKLCYVSQFVLFRVFNIFPLTEIVQIKGIGELLEGIVQYKTLWQDRQTC